MSFAYVVWIQCDFSDDTYDGVLVNKHSIHKDSNSGVTVDLEPATLPRSRNDRAVTLRASRPRLRIAHIRLDFRIV